MTRFRFVLSVVALLSVASPASAQTYAESNNAFAVDLYHQIAKDREGDNIFFSPFSLTTALTMTWAGADGTTADEMATVLHYDPTDRTTPHRQIKSLVDRLTDDPDEESFVVTVANDLWRDKSIRFKDDFANEMATYYEGAFHAVDFKQDAEGARQAINKRISDHTRKKIPELLKKRDITQDTIAVLTNAIYLKGMWEYPFDKEATSEGRFHLTPKKSVQTPMMRLPETSLRYGKGEGFQMVALPYVGQRASMLLLVPDEIDGLPALEKRLIPEKLGKWVEGMSPVSVTVVMPKFTLRDRTEMNSFLKDLGMELAFDPHKAELTRMFEGPTDGRPSISKVVHEAFIEVDEVKTEAAAATGVAIVAVALQPSFMVLANRPYLYLIRENETGAILFMGRMADPRTTE